jgi:hypothetical protein
MACPGSGAPWPDLGPGGSAGAGRRTRRKQSAAHRQPAARSTAARLRAESARKRRSALHVVPVLHLNFLLC